MPRDSHDHVHDQSIVRPPLHCRNLLHRILPIRQILVLQHGILMLLSETFQIRLLPLQTRALSILMIGLPGLRRLGRARAFRVVRLRSRGGASLGF